MSQLDLVIFDCDGVLVDSEIVAARVEAEMLREAGYDISAEELAERYSGLTFKDIMMHIEKEAQMLFQASLIEHAEARVDERLRAEVKAIPGVAEAISSLSVKRCICSNSREERIEAMLRRTNLARFFEDVIFSSFAIPTKRPKPAPDVFLYAAEQMGADPAKTIVIEDSVHGIAGAKAAGMRVIGFTGASHSHPRHASMLMEAGAETTISRMADLKATLAALAEWSAEG
ncbi:HAD family phosphatase [Chelativorans sp. J32]|uniref:HAD family hydrolase n=1 Tax=Chelativorans sp. J32 TaxID=935840 RepID=UPI000483A85D|nr:HAD family phosphatase [Chelativorans sp. J32]